MKGVDCMKSVEIKKFKMYITYYLIIKYKVSEEIANDAVQSSAINKLLKNDAESIMHDSVQFWAEEIWKEYNCVLA
jgi:hypothetical protein